MPSLASGIQIGLRSSNERPKIEFLPSFPSKNSMMRILYLGFWLPPDVAQNFPKLNGAGQLWESRLLQNLRSELDLRTASILDRKIQPNESDRAYAGRLLLEARWGKDLQAYPSFLELRKGYLAWRKQGWKPDFFLVYNSHPVGNAFVQFLAKRDPDVKRVLFFLDSKYFGKNIPILKRLRLNLKPLQWSDEKMLPLFHGVASASLSSKQFCQERKIPWHWFPGGAQADGLLDKIVSTPASTSRRIGYFGSHSEYAGLRELLAAFQTNPDLPLTLSIAGEGIQTADLKARTASDPRIEWVGFFKERSDLGRWASGCHVLVNPRPAGYGNDNNFPSKLFDFMQLGRAVISSWTPTLDHAFGDSLIWYDAAKPNALAQALTDVSAKSTTELIHQGTMLREKYSTVYAWDETIRGLKHWLGGI
jgi:glycosyltransferase involved in cell wall biosynthesis